MTETVYGYVKDGLVVPNQPLPEGVQVEIRVCATPIEVPPELQAEIDAWRQAHGRAWELVDRLLEDEKPNETR